MLLGVIERLTEFLPVSSTGHLILINQWVRFDESFTMKFDVIIQLGAILAVGVYFKNKLFDFQLKNGEWKRSPSFVEKDHYRRNSRVGIGGFVSSLY